LSFQLGSSCGTVGCAIGACPHVFPDIVRRNNDGIIWFINPELNDDDSGPSCQELACHIFGLTASEASHLFIHEEQNADRYGGQYLDFTATPEEVADNIEEFIRVMKQKEPNGTVENSTIQTSQPS
jgi:hypothetical protein